ncbi:membrane protein [Rhizocola hellebori]|uniref:Membrane protein n=1 Tax=Rhizocola hellebori TaxID=1392758 RepID=A0A8J3Q5U8_9ACTN|nr:membrane protein [Rhizocola hellebori]
MRNWFDPDEVRQVGSTPDYRFSLANERTFLAWIRTGLALIAAGLGVAQFLSPLPIPHLREILAILPIAVGAGCALRGIDHWIRCEVAMRTDRPLPPSRFPALLALVVAVSALLAVVYVIADATR